VNYEQSQSLVAGGPSRGESQEPEYGWSPNGFRFSIEFERQACAAFDDIVYSESESAKIRPFVGGRLHFIISLGFLAAGVAAFSLFGMSGGYCVMALGIGMLSFCYKVLDGLRSVTAIRRHPDFSSSSQGGRVSHALRSFIFLKVVETGSHHSPTSARTMARLWSTARFQKTAPFPLAVTAMVFAIAMSAIGLVMIGVAAGERFCAEHPGADGCHVVDPVPRTRIIR
jgi:hypothetical protein